MKNDDASRDGYVHESWPIDKGFSKSEGESVERTLESLSQNAKKYRDLFENAQMGMYRSSLDGARWLEANNRMAEMLGYNSIVEMLETPPAASLAGSQTGEELRKLLLESKILTYYPVEVIRPDGERRHILLSAKACTEDGYVVGTCADITDLVRAKESLRDSEERYRNLVETMNEGLVEVDAEGRIGYINTRFVEMTGYSKEELLLRDRLDLVAEAGRNRAQAEFALRRKGESSAWETIVLAKNGREIPVIVSASPIRDRDGNFRGSVAIFTDITSRKRAEEELQRSEDKYRTILETIADGYYEVDLAGNYTLVNDSMCVILGYSREELLQMNYKKIVDKETAERTYKAFNKVYQSGEPNPAFQHEVILKDRTRRDVSASVSLIRDAYCRPTGFRGIFRDISERERLEEQLRQAAKMEAIGTLASGIAHDFNNLLQVVLGRADILLLGQLTPDQAQKSLESIRIAARHGRDLVNRILTFTRKVKTISQPLDLNKELSSVETMLRRTIPRSVQIETRLGRDINTISADSSQVEQILLNLAVNAKDAMPHGGKLVFETSNVILDDQFCKTHLHLEPGEHVLLKVSDTGCGMPSYVQEHIFDPFYTTKNPGEGTGLGLAMVFGIVHGHGGHISCQSEVGKGTTFRLYFPAIVGEVKAEMAATTEMPAFGTETILLVDDDDLVRDLGKEILDWAGYTALTASNGLEALEIYRKEGAEISMVILDLTMPEMGGGQCLKELLAIDPRVKVIVASGYSVDGLSRELVSAGAKGFIGKPYDARQILRMVRKVLDET
jgi:two-component system cell cycle sensor histidine kinase/response regulator CckA